MARWIDAELLAKSYLNVAKEEPLTGLIFLSPEDVAKTILKLSEEFEDVAPVVHAHWVYRGKVDDYHNSYTCSNCLCVEILTTRSKVSYCWNCGAKMCEEVDDE